MLWGGICYGQPQPLRFDLSKIGLVVDGRQMCEDKGRLQDYPSKVMNEIIAAGPKAIPVLTDMVTDTRVAKTNEPIICYWPEMTIGDLAFCTLNDLFTDSSGSKTTMPGAGWNEILGPANDRPAWQQLHDYVRKNGRKSLQIKWQKLWSRYKGQFFWDAKERCFKLRASS